MRQVPRGALHNCLVNGYIRMVVTMVMYHHADVDAHMMKQRDCNKKIIMMIFYINFLLSYTGPRNLSSFCHKQGNPFRIPVEHLYPNSGRVPVPSTGSAIPNWTTYNSLQIAF